MINLYDPTPPTPGLPTWWYERRAHEQPDARDLELRERGVELDFYRRVRANEQRRVRR